MDFDFIRYKARVLQTTTTSFKVILFSVDIDIQSQMRVKAFKAGSEPFIVVWASSLQVDLIARALASERIAAEITTQSAIDVIAVALTALHMTIPMEELMEIAVTGRVCDGAPIIVDSMESLLAIITAMNTPASIHTKVNVSDTVDIVATLRTCGYVMANVQLTGELLALLTLSADVPLDVKTNTEDTLDIVVDVRPGNPVGMSLDSTDNLNLTVVVRSNGAIVIYALGEYELIATAKIALDSSKAIASNAESAGVITVVVRLLGYATLATYDANILATLAPLSLQAVAYIEI